jgi:bacteriorhodopsin
MHHALATLIGYFVIALMPTPAQAQGATAVGSDFPWLWVLVVVALLAAAVWWYMSRIRGRP